MIAFLLTLVLVQGIVGTAGGQVTGVLRMATGAPAAGVRVAAKPAVGADPGTALISLSETDAEGRFTLENVPPGRYQIVAGRIDEPTFYPGTLEAAGGTILVVTEGGMLSGIDFTLSEASIRQRNASNRVQVCVPVKVIVEGGGAVPAGTVQLIPVAGGTKVEMPLTGTQLAIPVMGVTEEYRVRVENLPNGYRVKSITFGTANLASEPLKASIGELSSSPAPRIITYTGEGEMQSLIDGIIARLYGPKTLSVTLEVFR